MYFAMREKAQSKEKPLTRADLCGVNCSTETYPCMRVFGSTLRVAQENMTRCDGANWNRSQNIHLIRGIRVFVGKHRPLLQNELQSEK